MCDDHTHTHTSSPRVSCVRVSALYVCPARGAEGYAREQMVVAGWEGGRAQRQRAQRERCRYCGLGWVRTSKILMQAFSSSLEQTLHYSSGRKSCTHSTMLVENGGQPSCWVVIQVLNSSQLQTCCLYRDIFRSW